MRRVVLALVVSGCVRVGAVSPAVASQLPAPSPQAPASAPLVRRLHALRDGLASRGVSFQGVASSGFIAHGGHVVTPFDVPAGRCLSVVALASGGVHDLDAQLYDPDGDMLVEDVETDSHPTVQLCADAPRRVFHLITAFEGNGAYVVASFLAQREGLDAIAQVVGGHPGTAGASGPARSELERRVSALRDGIARRGFQPTGEPTRITLSAGGRVRAAFPVTPDRCYTFGAFADGDLLDVNASVLDAAGEEVARDVRGERDALVQLCPRFATTLTLEASGARGEGAAVLQAWSADAAAVGGPSALWLGERVGWYGSAGSLEEAVREGNARVEAFGLRAVAAAHDETVTLAAGDAIERPRRLSPTGCTAVLASAGRGAGRVDLSLHAPDGGLIARGEQGLGGALLVACGVRAEAASLRVTLEAGGGEVRLRQLEGSAPGWMIGLDSVAAGEAWAARWMHPDGRWVARGEPLRVRVGGGARPMQSVDRAAGRCVRGVLLAGASLPSLSLVARDAEGRRLNRVSGEGRVAISRCGEAAETVRVELGTGSADEPATDALWMLWDEREPAAARAP